MQKNYPKKIIKLGDAIVLPDFKITKVLIAEEMVEATFNTGLKLYFGFNFPPLGFGPNGSHGYMYPEHLPFSHVGFIVSRNSFNQVQQRNSQETLQLKFDRNFIVNGEYALIDAKGVASYYTSALWSKHVREMKAHAESLKDRVFKDVRSTVYAILNSETGQTHNALLLSRITTEKKNYSVFLLFEETVVYCFPGPLIFAS